MCSAFATTLSPKERSANASQSCCDASFIGKGKTDGFANRTPLSKRRSADPTEGECQWVVEEECSDDDAAAHAQMPALRPALCQARSPGSAFVGDAWDKEEESRLSCPDSGRGAAPSRRSTRCPASRRRHRERNCLRWSVMRYSAILLADPRVAIDPPPRIDQAAFLSHLRCWLPQVTCSTWGFISERVRRIRTSTSHAPSMCCAVTSIRKPR